MSGNRYFFYSVLVNMVVNIMMFVPHVLYTGIFQGAVMSILVAIPIGMLLLYFFTRAMEQFPGEALFDVMKNVIPRWIAVPFFLYLALFWYSAGAIALISFADVTTRYMTPETSRLLVLLLFAVSVLIVSSLSTKRFLNGLEAALLINIPVIFLVLMKTVTDRSLVWSNIFDVATHVLNGPRYGMIAASTYIFSGYANLLVFGKEFRTQLKARHYLLVAAFGTMTLLTSFLIPIGRLGEFAVQRYSIPWIPTADSAQMQYFLIERLMIPFLLVYLMIALISASMHWHITEQLIRGQFKIKQKWHTYLIRALFAVVLYLLYKWIPDKNKLFDFVYVWMNLRLPSEILLVCVVMFVARRVKRHAKT